MRRFRAIFRRWLLLISITGLLAIIALDIASRCRVIELTWTGTPVQTPPRYAASVWSAEFDGGRIHLRDMDGRTGRVVRDDYIFGDQYGHHRDAPFRPGIDLRVNTHSRYDVVLLTLRPTQSWWQQLTQRRVRTATSFNWVHWEGSIVLAIPATVLGAMCVVALVSLLPGHLRTRRRRRAGQCLNCGYDLRATPDPAGPRLATCPECGRLSNVGVNRGLC